MDGTSVPTCFLFAEGIGGVGRGGGSTHFPTRLSAIVNCFLIERLLAAVQTCSAWETNTGLFKYWREILYPFRVVFFFPFFPPSFTSLRLLSAQLSLTVNECLSVSITIRRFAFGSPRLGSTPRSLNLREAESQSAVGTAKMKLRRLEGRPAG